MKRIFRTSALITAMVTLSATVQAGDKLELMDTFNLEMATAPTFSPNGKKIVYQRRSFDIMTDRARSNLWIMDADGDNARPLLSGKANYGGATYSPDGTRLAYVATVEGAPQLYVRWMDTGNTNRATNLQSSPSRLVWSPDGTRIAFTMFVPSSKKPMVKLPSAPKGAKWTPKPKFVDKLIYRRDGAGYAKTGNTHLFVLPAEGGTPRQLTSGAYDHAGAPTWAKDGKSLIISANRHDDIVNNPADSNLFR
ncbi:MAG: PD40 domain-containing protein, partial [Sphingomonadales bacterium]|nr:PD40 domain-containing protein [Sphingomonadales bacterium]